MWILKLWHNFHNLHYENNSKYYMKKIYKINLSYICIIGKSLIGGTEINAHKNKDELLNSVQI